MHLSFCVCISHPRHDVGHSVSASLPSRFTPSRPDRARHAPARGPSVASDPAPAADGPVPMPSSGRRRSLMAVGRVVRPVSAPRSSVRLGPLVMFGFRRPAPALRAIPPGPFPSRWRPLAPKARDPRGREETTGSEGVNDVVVVDAAGELPRPGRSPAVFIEDAPEATSRLSGSVTPPPRPRPRPRYASPLEHNVTRAHG